MVLHSPRQIIKSNRTSHITSFSLCTLLTPLPITHHTKTENNRLKTIQSTSSTPVRQSVGYSSGLFNPTAFLPCVPSLLLSPLPCSSDPSQPSHPSRPTASQPNRITPSSLDETSPAFQCSFLLCQTKSAPSPRTRESPFVPDRTRRGRRGGGRERCNVPHDKREYLVPCCSKTRCWRRRDGSCGRGRTIDW